MLFETLKNRLSNAGEGLQLVTVFEFSNGTCVCYVTLFYKLSYRYHCVLEPIHSIRNNHGISEEYYYILTCIYFSALFISHLAQSEQSTRSYRSCLILMMYRRDIVTTSFINFIEWYSSAVFKPLA